MTARAGFSLRISGPGGKAGAVRFPEEAAERSVFMHFVQVKGILSAQNGMNLYRGCSHGCIYCDSRSACYPMDHAFEDIEVKETPSSCWNRLCGESVPDVCWVRAL